MSQAAGVLTRTLDRPADRVQTILSPETQTTAIEGIRPTLSERSISGSRTAASRGSSTGENGRAA